MRAGEPERRVELVATRELVVEGDPELPLLLGDLLGNAWELTRRQPAARVELGRGEAGDATAYHVRDDGAGIDVALADTLFPPLGRLHTASELARDVPFPLPPGAPGRPRRRRDSPEPATGRAAAFWP